MRNRRGTSFLLPEFDATDVLVRGTMHSDSSALFYVALARAIGIPARVVYGFVYVAGPEPAFMPRHWCEVCIDDRWVAIDPFTGEFPVHLPRLRAAPVPPEFLATVGPFDRPELVVVEER